MASKLMTLKELADYLNVSEDKIITLVDEKIIVAYKIGGELLRFRKEQIDATRAEIEERVNKKEKFGKEKVAAPSRNSLRTRQFAGEDSSLKDRVADFFYFNDFYIAAGILIVLLLLVIFRT